jgi:hypothetical protein
MLPLIQMPQYHDFNPTQSKRCWLCQSLYLFSLPSLPSLVTYVAPVLDPITMSRILGLGVGNSGALNIRFMFVSNTIRGVALPYPSFKHIKNKYYKEAIRL